jgi:hypothetical protein
MLPVMSDQPRVLDPDRRKGISEFDTVSVVIFFVALDEYNLTLEVTTSFMIKFMFILLSL